MKIIYCCYGGSHSSVTAAAIHLGMLPITKKPTSRELLSVPYYEQQKGQEHGTLRFMGNDEYGNQVYIVGKHNLGHLFEDIIRQFATAFRISQGDFVIVDTIPYVNLAMMFGGFTSQKELILT